MINVNNIINIVLLFLGIVLSMQAQKKVTFSINSITSYDIEEEASGSDEILVFVSLLSLDFNGREYDEDLMEVGPLLFRNGTSKSNFSDLNVNIPKGGSFGVTVQLIEQDDHSRISNMLSNSSNVVGILKQLKLNNVSGIRRIPRGRLSFVSRALTIADLSWRAFDFFDQNDHILTNSIFFDKGQVELLELFPLKYETIEKKGRNYYDNYHYAVSYSLNVRDLVEKRPPDKRSEVLPYNTYGDVVDKDRRVDNNANVEVEDSHRTSSNRTLSWHYEKPIIKKSKNGSGLSLEFYPITTIVNRNILWVSGEAVIPINSSAVIFDIPSSFFNNEFSISASFPIIKPFNSNYGHRLSLGLDYEAATNSILDVSEVVLGARYRLSPLVESKIDQIALSSSSIQGFIYWSLLSKNLAFDFGLGAGYNSTQLMALDTNRNTLFRSSDLFDTKIIPAGNVKIGLGNFGEIWGLGLSFGLKAAYYSQGTNQNNALYQSIERAENLISLNQSDFLFSYYIGLKITL